MQKIRTIFSKATVLLAVAFVVLSCKSELETTSSADKAEIPLMVVDDMFIVQTNRGKMQLRVSAPLMRRFHNDSLDYEVFPEGLLVYSYNEAGLLETELKADEARHESRHSGGDGELWMAFGNVSVKNLINKETMTTDTLYWDRQNEKIYTDCYVCLLSPSGLMQGYGMESDQRARNSTILKPFNSYGIIDNDSTKVVIDSVNFIGPFPLKEQD